MCSREQRGRFCCGRRGGGGCLALILTLTTPPLLRHARHGAARGERRAERDVRVVFRGVDVQFVHRGESRGSARGAQEEGWGFSSASGCGGQGRDVWAEGGEDAFGWRWRCAPRA